MVINTMGNLRTMNFKEKESIFIRMEMFIKDNGKIVKYKDGG